jgi:ATP-binding cassette subfamily C protein CydD
VEISLRLMNGRLPFERALAVLIITPEFFLPLRQYAMRYHVGTAGKAAAGRIYSILDRPVLAVARPAASAGRPAPERLDIYFEDVSYYYEDGERPALQGASLRLPHGKATALVGVSGSGKTTVARLLLRFIEPEQGAITVDGTPLAEIERLSWAATVAWVPQHPYLFAGTVAENLRLARPGASEEELIAAARAAHAHPFIEQLPLGYDTPLGEKGARLSGGQAQRLAIGRAFLKDASLLILDEATSQLDQRSEALIRQALARLVQGRTTLIISHRMQWAVFADQVVVLEAGRAIQAGAHAALIEQDGAYRRLAAAFEKGEA